MQLLPPGLLLAALPLCTTAFNFLVYLPLNARSHVNFMSHVANALSDAGHNVTLIIPIIDSHWKSSLDVRGEVIFVPQCEAARYYEETDRDLIFHATWREADVAGAIAIVQRLFDAWRSQCNATLHNTQLFERLRARHFDAGITELIDYCGVATFHALGIEKTALTMSVAAIDGAFNVVQQPTFPSYVPTAIASFSDRMSFLERVANTLLLSMSYTIGPWMMQSWNVMLKEALGPDTPSTMELSSRASLLFMNNEPLLDFPRPIVSKTIDIGGISVPKPGGELNATWSAIMGLRPRTVLISFGSVALSHLMPEEYKQTIRTVAGRFPDVTFIWKYEKPEDGISKGVENLVESTWLPQSALLCQSNAMGTRKIMLSESALAKAKSSFSWSRRTILCFSESLDKYEAAAAGAPLVVIPVLGDQMRNAATVRRAGTGVVLEKAELAHADALEAAIRELLENPGYTTRARALSEMLRNKPFAPQELLVRNMEFLAAHGPLRMLDHHSKHLNFLQFYLIDVFAFLFVIITASVILVIFVVSRVFKCLIRRLAVKQKQS